MKPVICEKGFVMAQRSYGYRARNAARRRKKLEKTNRTGLIIITLSVIILTIVLWTRTGAANNKVNRLDKEIESLEEQQKEQEDRAISLEERKVYVQTKKYIEEVAKRLGLVYPDEIIYKPSK